ncbi:alpha-amylase family glycosyl hydrolase [Okeania sp.]|uniref:alpha-amylase family glycosyl hydrolase n=1 Tax=Okeania sp. TaxID=3100323 RepID=UPI002B4B4169|nr:alpha-amylase family glycosyl hydrolase [Okeania sp.]MEB3343702.1 alpha-amylase family glycosyl hydrolase [Okeania sp.]
MINPSLYQINTRVWLNKISQKLGHHATLDDIPDDELDQIANLGFDWVYFLGVWQTGIMGRDISRANPDVRTEGVEIFGDNFHEDYICGSCFAITDYHIHENLGDNEAMLRLRDRLHQRGLKLMLDFVPNHTAPDHLWVETNSDFYVQGTQANLEEEPHNYIQIESSTGSQIFAYGRDPYFPGWSDALQLNYGNPKLQEAMLAELFNIARLCDGVRCDMAMLLLPNIFQHTWGISMEPFWDDAISQIKQQYPDFILMAEVYWNLEWELQQLGFDYTYDKRLYDRLREQQTVPVRLHLYADLNFQSKLARFIENHDEPRANVVFPARVNQAAAILTYFTPGLRFFHQGQLQGWSQKISVHLCDAPEEPAVPKLERFYHQLLDCLALNIVREGNWQLLECIAAWEGNFTWNNFIAFVWKGKDERLLLITVNYAAEQSQCYVLLPFESLRGQMYQVQDLMSDVSYDRLGDKLISRGLYLDIPGWGYHIFDIS